MRLAICIMLLGISELLLLCCHGLTWLHSVFVAATHDVIDLEERIAGRQP